MAERTTVTELTQIGVESTYGTAVSAGKRLPSLSFDFGIKVNIDAYRPKGDKFNTIHALGKEWTEGKIGGGATYSELHYIFSSLLAYASPAQQSSTTAYKWTHQMSPTAPDTVKSFTVEVGSSVHAHKIAGVQVTELMLTGTRESIELSGTALGTAIADDITLTSSPTAIAQVPMLPKEFDVYLDSSSGSIGTTKLTRCLKWSWTIGNRFSPLWVVNSANASFVALNENAVTAQVKLLVEADDEGMALIDYARTGATVYGQIKGTSGTNAGTAIPYSVLINNALQVADVSEFSDEDGVQAVELTLDIVDDAAGLGYANKIELINKATAL